MRILTVVAFVIDNAPKYFRGSLLDYSKFRNIHITKVITEIY